jgi:NADPH-dependent glutamate synthase beta subunit-like oxidoreductase
MGTDNLFIGGELKHGSGLIVKAVADGKQAALRIMEILGERST